ncbi:secretin N-terminal domain-containing protein [Pseudomonas sp. B6002]|uniref:secretin N-terminal domain-containing protein n=1 Tax=Pseudomonas sp. B6002 TaxID=2726978 RepID=UPI003527D238
MLLLCCAAAWGEVYQTQDASLGSVLNALSGPLGVAVVVSRQVDRKRVSGSFDFAAPEQVLEALARQEGLIWHRDRQALYLYEAAEIRRSAVVLRHISVSRLRSLMQGTGLDESRFPLRESGQRMFYVSGPPSYVDRVLRLAQLMDRQPAKVPEQAFGVVAVLHHFVADRKSGAGADEPTVPGMNSMIETLLVRNRKHLLADKGFAVIAYPDINSLLVRGTPAQVKLIKQWVAELDVPQQANEPAPP